MVRDEIIAELRGKAAGLDFEATMRLFDDYSSRYPTLWRIYPERAQVPTESGEIYKPPPSCQIPGLASLYGQIFGRACNGTFLEIGAYDGESHSNTSFLADLGWTGIYVEPVPQFAEKCRRRHKDNSVTVIEAAVTEQAGTLRLEIAGSLSTADKFSSDRHRSVNPKAFSGNYVEACALTLDGLLREAEIGPDRTVDLLVIDCEGFEWEIVKQIDFTTFRHRVAIIESRDLNVGWPEEMRAKYKLLVARYIDAGYRVFWRDGLNIIFLAPWSRTSYSSGAGEA